MFNKLQNLKERYEELTSAMNQPEVMADYARLQEILKEEGGIGEAQATQIIRRFETGIHDMAASVWGGLPRH